MSGTIILCATLVLNALSLMRLDNRSNDMASNHISNNNTPLVVRIIQQKVPQIVKNYLHMLKAFHNITLIINVLVVLSVLIGYIVV